MRIVAVCRDNMLYRRHKVDKSSKEEEDEEKEEQSMLTLPMEITELYKIPNNLRALEVYSQLIRLDVTTRLTVLSFIKSEELSSSSSKDNQNFYSQKEALELLWKYVAANELNSKITKGAVSSISRMSRWQIVIHNCCLSKRSR